MCERKERGIAHHRTLVSGGAFWQADVKEIPWVLSISHITNHRGATQVILKSKEPRRRHASHKNEHQKHSAWIEGGEEEKTLVHEGDREGRKVKHPNYLKIH